MKPRTLLGLALVVVAMGLFIFFFEREIPSTEERKEQAEKVLLFAADEVTRLSWRWGDEAVELVRKSIEEDGLGSQASWLLIEADPLHQGRADDVAVNAFLGSLLDWKLESRIEQADRAEIGLEAPRAELRLETSRGAAVVRFGAALPVGQAMVVEVEGNIPVVVSDAVWGELSKPPGDWRSKEIFQISRDAIRQIRLVTADSTVLLVSRDGALWLEEPVSDLASQDLARGLLGSLTGLRAESWVDDPAVVAEAGLAPPASPVATLEIFLEDSEEPLVVELGAEVQGVGGQIYARAENRTFITGDSLLEVAVRPANDWRSLTLTALDRWQIERIEIEDDEESLVVERSGGDWQRGGATIDYSLVDELLGWLAEARAEALIDEDGPEFRPAIVCALLDSEGRREELRFYEIGSDSVARNSTRTVSLSLAAGAVQELSQKIAGLRGAEAQPGEGDLESP